MARLKAILGFWRSWSVRRRALAAGGALLVAAAAALGVYELLKRPSDVSNPDAEFLALPREDPKPKRRKPRPTVDWPVYGGNDQRTRYLPTKRLGPPFASSEWSYQAGKLLEFSPILADRTLYVIDKDALVIALGAGRGKVRWKTDVGSLSASSPAYYKGRIFVVTLSPGQTVALRARDGKVLWRKPMPGRTESSPMVVGGKVIVGNEAGRVYALDPRDGSTVWETITAGAVKGALALENGLLYVGDYAGEVYAIEAADGDIRWQASGQGLSFGRSGRFYSTPAVAWGRVYIGGIDSRVYSFEAASGELAWSFSTGDEVYPAPAVASTPGTRPTVYIGSLDQNLYAIDARTGSERWRADIGAPVLGAATVIGRTVYVAGIGPNVGTLGFDVKTGEKVFEHELGEYNPVISDGRQLYLTGASAIRAFRPKTRAELQRERKRKGEARARRAKRERQGRAERRRRGGGRRGGGR